MHKYTIKVLYKNGVSQVYVVKRAKEFSKDEVGTFLANGTGAWTLTSGHDGIVAIKLNEVLSLTVEPSTMYK